MIQSWVKIPGAETTLASKYGKKMVAATFADPRGVEHEFVLFGQKDWSIILPVTADNKVVMVRQYKQGCDKIILELPAGTADFAKESPEAIARRELEEETGYRAGQVLALGPPLWIASRSSWTRFHCFLALQCEKVSAGKLDENEEIEVVLQPLEEVIRICHLEIEEPSTVVTVFRALPHLTKNH